MNCPLFSRSGMLRSMTIMLSMLFVFAVKPAIAGDEPQWISKFEGKIGEIDTGFIKETIDINYFDSTKFDLIDNPLNDIYQNTISLELDETSLVPIPGNFWVTVRMNIIWMNKDGSMDSIAGKELTINYDTTPGSKYKSRNYFVFTNARKVKIRIVGIVRSDNTWPWESVLLLKNTMDVKRDYTFECGAKVDISGSEPVTASASGEVDELIISWTDVPLSGRTHYDVEWTWVDEEAADRYKDGPDFDADLVFKNNSSRVTIPAAGNFRVPLIYDGTGYLFFRVRPVQYREDGSVREGAWSTDDGDINYETITDAYEEELNWQVSTTFAEDGKRQTVVQFYDGSMRSRQTVTKDNNNNTTIVAETMYDYQGRPAINILPAPTLDNVIAFAKNFNRFSVSGDFKDQFDAGSCASVTPAMDSAYGAAKYYSSNNEKVNEPIHKYIPNSYGYPYSQTRYTPDATGRIESQGGVGPVHQLGDNHETKYYYGSVDQQELDALFGTEAGDNSHYFKNMVRDANGQYSVSYVDMHGRTVATALAGEAPTNVSQLPSYSEKLITKNLLPPGVNTIKDRTIESSTTLLVTKTGTHTFNYTMDPLSFSLGSCSEPPGPICYDCYYDLEIRITGDCGHEPIIIARRNFTLGEYDVTCENQADPITIVDEEYTLTPGEYNITKILTLSSNAQDWYRENQFDVNNVCKTLQDFYDEAYEVLLSDSTCFVTCQQCQAALGTSYEDYRDKFLQEMGIADENTLVPYEAEIKAAYDEAKAACDELCNGYSAENPLDYIRQMMLMDMLPDQGQYALLDKDLNGNQTATDVYVDENGVTQIEQNSTRLYNIFNKTNPVYKSPVNAARVPDHYKTATGEPDPALYPAGAASLPGIDMTAEAFSSLAKESWAASLLPYHPEYARLKFAEENLRTSYDFDARLQRIDTWADAAAAGLITGILTLDPLFSNPLYDEYHDEMYTKINTLYRDNRTMWQMAWMSVNCLNSTDRNCGKNMNVVASYTTDCPGDWDMIWRVFRNIYLSEKDKMIENLFKVKAPIDYGKIDDNKYARRFITADGTTWPLLTQIQNWANLSIRPRTLQAAQLQANAYTNAQLAQVYDQTCDGYIAMWEGKLMNCDQVMAMDNNVRKAFLAEVTAGLKDVCIRGSDLSHVYGSSTIKPSAPPTPRAPYTFQEVIEAVFIKYGITQNEMCHPFVINYPPPYEAQQPASNYVVAEPKDGCICLRIKELKTEKSSYSGTLSQFIQFKYGVTISQSTLDMLETGCNSTDPDACKLYEPPIEVPALLSCNPPTKGCIDCGEYRKLKSEFKTKYPSYNIIYADPATDLEVAYNNMFASFMNARTGLNKSWVDYMNFETACNNYNTTYSTTLDSRILDSLVIAYYVSHSDTLSGDSCRTLFTNFINTALSSSYTFAQIQTLYEQYSGHFPDVCQPVMNCTKFNVVIDSFYHAYGDTVRVAGNCKTLFTGYFNTQFATDYTWEELELLSLKVCGKPLDVCNPISCSHLQHILDTWITCHAPAVSDTTCETGWINYFNWAVGGSYESWQIDSIYKQCGLRLDPCQPQVTCDALQQLLFAYYNQGTAACKTSGLDSLDADYCTDCFTWFVNNRLGTHYSNADLVTIYQKACGIELAICKQQFNCMKLSAFTQTYVQWYMQYTGGGSCDSLFTVHFNTEFGTSYANEDIIALYRQYCGREPGVCIVQNPPVSCVELKNVYNDFFLLYPDPARYFGDSCQAGFTRYFNHVFNDTLTYEDIALYYQNLCNEVLLICETDTCARYQSFLSNYDSLYGSYHLPQQLCRDLFTKMFNNEFKPAQPYLWQDIDSIYKHCGDTLSICAADTAYTIACENLQAARSAFFAFYSGGFPSDCGSAFTAFFNLYFQTSFANYDELDLWARSNCGDTLNVCSVTETVNVYLRSTSVPPPPTMGPRLCGIADPIFPTVTVEEEGPCDVLEELALSIATQQYTAYIEQQHAIFNDLYRSNCLNTAAAETFTVRAPVAEYHYTLYYYDQAGNLVKTIPPAGVDVSKFDDLDTWHATVQAAKDADPQTEATPSHTLATIYKYNTLNQVVEQKSPDGGLSKFYYDALGRLVVSQNAKQAAMPGRFSYTKYDELGRITEVGQISADVPMTQATAQDPVSLAGWFSTYAGNRSQITSTVYDLADDALTGLDLLDQKNLRNRVSYTSIKDLASDTYPATSTYYTYDIHGNVDILMQYYHKGTLHDVTNNYYKRIYYDYDLVSGKVNQVSYQPGMADEFYHKYEYDAANRLTHVFTSHDKVYWERQATYDYYKHGPLARAVIGQLGVQGIDYAYTLQGWLKGVNTSNVGPGGFDMGGDGATTDHVARDAYGFSLDYYKDGGNRDYKAIKPGQYPFADVASSGLTPHTDGVQTGLSLYNGNIASMLVNIPKVGDAYVYGYKYDQLNRIVAMNAYTGMDMETNNFTPVSTEKYKERVTYDGNGNILTYLRNGNSPLAMDELTYHYVSGKNQLEYVDDPTTSTNYSASVGDKTEDIDDQPSGNYGYDEIGNLTKDVAAGIGSNGITWTVYGKIASITKTVSSVTTTISYTYDASGNRISKKVEKTGATTRYTWYVRDATGNVMAIYENGNESLNSGHLTQTEVHLYGSSRLGLWHSNRDVEATDWWLKPSEPFGDNPDDRIWTHTWERGQTNYELTNHLGNVLVTISDKRIGVVGEGEVYDHWEPEIVTANDYYPFGMGMPGRKYHQDDSYRYGFNGKENDNDVKGDGNQIAFEARIYDARLGRWLSLDPLQSNYPDLTPYNFVSNSPLNAIDPNGKLIIFINGLWGWPMGVRSGGTSAYWGWSNGKRWSEAAQDAIGDHKTPRFYDGSMGGIWHFGGKSSLYEQNRIDAGKDLGYKEAKGIIDNLDKDETIKFITNSMGAAFERGFSEGLLQYRDERVSEIETELFMTSLRKSELSQIIGEDRIKELNQIMIRTPKTPLEKEYETVSNKIDQLNNEKQKLQNVEVEMVIDLSAHQTDRADPNSRRNYYMTAEENITYVESTLGVDEKKHIRHSWYLGKMDGHHASWVDPSKFPKATKPN